MTVQVKDDSATPAHRTTVRVIRTDKDTLNQPSTATANNNGSNNDGNGYFNLRQRPSLPPPPRLSVFSVSVVCNSKLGEAYDEHAATKLSDDVSAGFTSIDCGASGDYKDNETGLFYESDMKYIDTGEIHQPSPNLTEGLYKQQVKNLRSFPHGTRNCYTLIPKQGANNNYLIRTAFMYGNYDNKNQFPIFDLYLGVNKWVTHNASTASSYYYEIIHVPMVDYIDVCLVNTGNGIPFISALELRPLDDTEIYQMRKNEAKRTVRRYDVGGQHNQQGTGSIRYPGDSYDRIWIDLNFDDWNRISTDSTIYAPNIDDGNYKVPDEVLKTAATSQDAMSPLSLFFNPQILLLNAMFTSTLQKFRIFTRRGC
ncbi:probable LRR receptor-like serine/threonine-protein kinase At4g29180 isoform X1 [Pistacia vera]|uniref:probable LRR receptor-like serine/threonine-protein kinase At4g29180 isoform X1 n=1 Tax=Pistacia vera TaxID=55513 RepID=UPI001263B355|nr:probable LRR receptor-like serine/threonine-protein kinase At4g29180 isoform X1 [Pistacia vera]